jgi:hypothetical protein
MLIITTIYCTELDAAKVPAAEKSAQQNIADLKDTGRELLSIYQGKKRVQP